MNPKPKPKKMISRLSILVLMIASLPVQGFNQQSGQINPPRGQQLNPAVVSKVMATAKNYRVVQRELLKAGVAFDPGILYTKGWRQKLAPIIAAMPQMQATRLGSQSLKGAQLAGELQLPEKVDLVGDTVILARRVKFLGSKVTIKGPYDIHIFTIESFKTETGSGSITIDTSGLGRKEWLEAIKNKPVASAKTENKTVSLTSEDENGAPGRDGDPGLPGTNGFNATAYGTPGDNGSCQGDTNGQTGDVGPFGGDASNDAEKGGMGNPGGPGGSPSLYINDPNDTTEYTINARGGDGGKGGPGGPGGVGGYGGVGGRGGNGASCSCAPGGVGMGGNGGRGGRGGRGGNGGDGGDGGDGGPGGYITISYPSGYDINHIHTNVSGGQAGGGGHGLPAGQGGQPGDGGDGGDGGSVSGCSSGGRGQHGGSGNPGDAGERSGNPSNNTGAAGVTGGASFSQYGGGGGGPELEPGGSYPNGSLYCTDWYWVYYSWNGSYYEETGRVYAYQDCYVR